MDPFARTASHRRERPRNNAFGSTPDRSDIHLPCSIMAKAWFFETRGKAGRMRSSRYRPISALLLLTFAGCGTIPAEPEVLQGADPQELMTAPQQDRVGSADGVVVDAPANTQLPASDQALTDSSSPVPPSPNDLGFPLSDMALFPELLSSFVDGLLLDILQPSVPQSGPSFLEQLCRDSDIPDFRCRQLYAD